MRLWILNLEDHSCKHPTRLVHIILSVHVIVHELLVMDHVETSDMQG